MFHIKSIISDFLQRKGIKKQIEAIEVCKIADIILKEAFDTQGIKASRHKRGSPRAAFFQNSTLKIKCSNSVLANEIQLRKERIKNEINKRLDKNIVKDILTKIG